MARKLLGTESFDVLYDELDYTEGRVLSDPITKGDPTFTSWSPPRRARVAEVERAYREARRQVALSDAAFTGANFELDARVEELADALLAACRKDRQSPRYLAIFPMAVSTFNRLALAVQLKAVRGWILGSTDPVVEAARPELRHVADAASAAIEQGAAANVKRAEARTARARLAEELTAARDELQETLGARGRAANRPRGWAATFFRVRASEPDAPASTGEPEGTP